jgi:hypothetical protein
MRQTKERTPARNGRSSSAVKASDNTKPSAAQPSWRDFCKSHPAAEFFHDFSSEEQLEELREDIDKQQVILDPIHTASVFGKTFVIDGISRLDAVEETGRQIVDEKGNWIGVLEGHVVHHPGRTDEEVWDLVISLNLKRRHLTTKERADVAVKLADYLQAKAEKRSFVSNDKKLSKRGRAEGRPSEGKTESVEHAAKTMNVSPSTVRRAQERQDQTDHRKTESQRKTHSRKEKPFRNIASQAYLWFHQRLSAKYDEVEWPEAVHGIIQAYLEKPVKRDLLVPTLHYPDGSESTLEAAINATIKKEGRQR